MVRHVLHHDLCHFLGRLALDRSITNDKSLGHFPGTLVGDLDHRAVGHGRVGEDVRFELGGCDLVALFFFFLPTTYQYLDPPVLTEASIQRAFLSLLGKDREGWAERDVP